MQLKKRIKCKFQQGWFQQASDALLKHFLQSLGFYLLTDAFTELLSSEAGKEWSPRQGLHGQNKHQWINPRILNKTWALLPISTGTTALFPGDSSACVSCPSSPWQERESCFQISPTSAPIRSNTTKTELVPVYIKIMEVEALEISIFQSVKRRQPVMPAYLRRDLGWHINICSAFTNFQLK